MCQVLLGLGLCAFRAVQGHRGSGRGAVETYILQSKRIVTNYYAIAPAICDPSDFFGPARDFSVADNFTKACSSDN